MVSAFFSEVGNTYVCVPGGKKCSFFGRFGVLSFLETLVLRFAVLHYYRRSILWNVWVFFEFVEKIRPDKYFLTLSWRRTLWYKKQSSELQCKLYDWFLCDSELRDTFIFLYVDILLLVPKCKFIIKNSSLKCWLCLADKSNFH